MKPFWRTMEDPKEIISKPTYIRKVHFFDNCSVLHELFRFINLNYKLQGKHKESSFQIITLFYLKLNRKVVMVFKKEIELGSNVSY